MIDFKKAFEIAIKKKPLIEKEFHNKILFTDCIECEAFFCINFGLVNHESGEIIPVYGEKMAIDISKENGSILDYPMYFPGTEYGDMIDKGKKLEIPEEYRG